MVKRTKNQPEEPEDSEGITRAFTVRLPDPIYTSLQAVAVRQHTSTNSLIVSAVDSYIAQNAIMFSSSGAEVASVTTSAVEDAVKRLSATTAPRKTNDSNG